MAVLASPNLRLRSGFKTTALTTRPPIRTRERRSHGLPELCQVLTRHFVEKSTGYRSAGDGGLAAPNLSTLQ